MAEFHTIRDDVRLRWQVDGAASAPAILFLNSLGTDLSMWDGVVQGLGPDFRALRMDMRGHGGSGVPEGDYSMEELALDAAAVLDAAGVESAAVCGLSIGGMVAMQLALDAPDRVGALIIANSAAQMPYAPWADRAGLVREQGMEAVADRVIERFFSEPFRRRNAAEVAGAKSILLRTAPQGYAASCMAIAGIDLFGRLKGLRKPVLVINGELDEATPPAEHGDRIAAEVPAAQSIALPAGHLSAIEAPAAFAAAIASFLKAARVAP